MTIKMLELRLDGDRTVIIETDDLRPRAGAVSAVTKLRQSFSEVVDQLAALVTPIHDRLAESVSSADQITVEFGFKVSADTGIIIAKTQAEGNFRVSLSWKKTP